ncbi:snare-like protein [Teratosphaeria nubilosa]|uniref:Trafficking protein particle complex subunit n=1 Tax=Teratosphaeria nubilosa TaxID=161662 RepID=A0A6G1L1X4_9PEZI|nr:snare-like protein [Teratosphaeria nubilosa]
MSVYSFYIFDRHTDCIYTKRWPTAVPSHPAPTTSKSKPSTTTLTTNGSVPAATKPNTKDADATKLIFGTIFSLRRMCRQLGGASDSFLAYRTGEYKLHYFETPTQLKFVLLTDTRVGNMRTVLHQIWATLFVEYVVKSGLTPVGARGLAEGGKGVANELFDGGVEKFIDTIFKRDEQQ